VVPCQGCDPRVQRPTVRLPLPDSRAVLSLPRIKASGAHAARPRPTTANARSSTSGSRSGSSRTPARTAIPSGNRPTPRSAATRS
jgi:hypothetical protein